MTFRNSNTVKSFQILGNLEYQSIGIHNKTDRAENPFVSGPVCYYRFSVNTGFMEKLKENSFWSKQYFSFNCGPQLPVPMPSTL